MQLEYSILGYLQWQLERLLKVEDIVQSHVELEETVENKGEANSYLSQDVHHDSG